MRQNTAQTLLFLREHAATQLRMAWCDVHGQFHCKTVLPRAFEAALNDGIRMAGTLMLKDRSGRTALPVFDTAQMRQLGHLAAFAQATDVHLVPDLASICMLAWASGVAWLRCDIADAAGRATSPDPRNALMRALDGLRTRGWRLNIGIELEFHVYRQPNTPRSPADATWPSAPPSDLALLHGGYQLLSERHADACHEVFELLQRCCEGLGLPLVSLEIEMGPSQFEAVFAVQDALAAADCMALFRSAAQQALARAGYFVSFCARPPFEHIMSSGWHLHQSLTDVASGATLFASNSDQPLSDVGMHYLAGLLQHSAALAAVAVPSINGYARFAPNQLAPSDVSWGIDSRGALVRVIGQVDAARIENRLGTPDANPYLTIATQLQAGLDGIDQALIAPPPNTNQGRLPTTLIEALNAMAQNPVVNQTLGKALHTAYDQIKRQEFNRYTASTDRAAWLAAEYFGG